MLQRQHYCRPSGGIVPGKENYQLKFNRSDNKCPLQSCPGSSVAIRIRCRHGNFLLDFGNLLAVLLKEINLQIKEIKSIYLQCWWCLLYLFPRTIIATWHAHFRRVSYFWPQSSQPTDRRPKLTISNCPEGQTIKDTDSIRRQTDDQDGKFMAKDKEEVVAAEGWWI